MAISQVNVNGFNPPGMRQADTPALRVAVPEQPRNAPAQPVELPSKAVQATKETLDASSLRRATEKINQTIKMMANNLQFTVDEDTGIDVVKVVDTETKDVIRQFPSEEVLAIAKALDQLQGLLVKEKA